MTLEFQIGKEPVIAVVFRRGQRLTGQGDEAAPLLARALRQKLFEPRAKRGNPWRGDDRDLVAAKARRRDPHGDAELHARIFHRRHVGAARAHHRLCHLQKAPDVEADRGRRNEAEFRQDGVAPTDRRHTVKDMSKANLARALLQRRAGVGHRDEMVASPLLALQCDDAVEKVVQEDIGLQRTAGLGGDDEQSIAELDRALNRLDLLRVGAVQHVEAWPPQRPLEGLAENRGTEARTAHPQKDDVGEVAFHLVGKIVKPIDVGQLLLRDVQPTDPFAFVGSAPERFVSRPQAPNPALRAPGFHLGIHGGLHLRGTRDDFECRAVAVHHSPAPARNRAEQLVEGIGGLLHAFLHQIVGNLFQGDA